MKIEKEIQEELERLNKPWSELSEEFEDIWHDGLVGFKRALKWVLENKTK